MHPAYFETVFTAKTRHDQWPAAFAIITTFATTGEAWSAEQNEAADQRLRGKLQELISWMHRLTGGSPDGRHREPGWAVEINLTEAKQIGIEFKQDAIYWVSGDTLYVTHCIASAPLVRVGLFLAHLQ